MCTENNACYAYNALFEHWFMEFGLPEELRSGNGSEYINTEVTHLCKYFEIKFKPSTTYALWTNGLVEGTNRIIGQFIRTLVDGKYNNCFALLRSLKTSSYPKQMFYKNKALEDPIAIANCFNNFFEKNFNASSYVRNPLAPAESIRL